MKLVIDTSVIIDFLRQKDKATTWLYSLAQEKHQLIASIITHTELYAGKGIWEQKTAQTELQQLFSGIKLIPLTKKISQQAGKITATTGINLLDAIIAATALNEKIPLATLNQKHFQNIPHLKLLQHPFLF